MGRRAGKIKYKLSDIAIVDPITIAQIAATVGTGLNGKDGKDGRDGRDGYTPVKGLDYFDGAPGTPGVKGDSGTNGSDATVTKSAVESVLTGEISTHTHVGGLTQQQILRIC